MKLTPANFPPLVICVIVVTTLATIGCPPASATKEQEPSYMADVIPITSDMGPCERAIIGDLNKNRDTRGSMYSGDRRDALLTAWAILKSKGNVHLVSKVEEDE